MNAPTDFNLPATGSPVSDDVLIYRLVPTWQCEVVDGLWEFVSGAFDNATPESPVENADDMSVVLGDTLDALRRDPTNLPGETPWAGPDWGVAVLQAQYLRRVEDQVLLRTPNEELAHGDVRGSKGHKRRRRLKKHARWVVRPAASPPS